LGWFLVQWLCHCSAVWLHVVWGSGVGVAARGWNVGCAVGLWVAVLVHLLFGEGWNVVVAWGVVVCGHAVGS